MHEGLKSDRQPLWVRIFWIVLALAVIGIGAMMLTGGHGPWQHDPTLPSQSSGESSSQ